jgi:long-chain acyl-CoA synthetase
MFHHFMAVAKRCGADILDGKSVGFGDRLQYWLGNLLVYGPLRNVLGMSRIRVAYTAGAAIGPDLFRFYRSIGINLKQFYGQTETCAYVCLQPDGQIKFDSVGQPAPASRSRSPTTARCWSRGRCCSRNTTSARMPRPSRSTPRATS